MHKFIKLSLDNDTGPVWINTHYIMSLNATKKHGTYVAMMGDGYSNYMYVDETPEEILELIRN